MSAIWSLLNRFLRQSPSVVEIQHIDEYDRESLVIDITQMLQRAQPLSSPEHAPCIYKVPDPLRKLNEEAYTPQIISIGPFHHGNKKLQTMEKYKESYLKGFVDRADSAGIGIEILIRAIEISEQRVRQSYAETIPLCRYDFVKMVLMDASFIVELFYRNWPETSEWTPDDYIIQKPWLAYRMQLDFMLLENQLPFFIIKELFDLAFASQTNLPSFIELTFHYFSCYNRQGLLPDPDLNILHFVDLLRKFYLPAPPRTLPRRRPAIVPYMYAATQLDEVGLKFEVNPSSKCLLDLHYEEGVLKIPRFTLDDYTELYARNLMALEQCHYQHRGYITDYFQMLDLLIKSEKDVDLLSREGIVVNGLGHNDATFINNLGTGIVYSTMSCYYLKICDNLKKFYENPSHGWIASLRRDYFRTPWMAASTIAAVILLILTLIQAVCSIIAV
ncbi:UPF0481 protein At3g47200-like [Corylus avellana]|uniref:UPF0481 protein At3g47200-like n=1 Tax=Corylus avellana TaxID=13451 RepID=UPI001E22F5F5|nr:UPF0481 protein At3g47200-like [Corylus avellana]